MRNRTDITIVTNGVSSLLELADSKVEVVVLGGRLRRPNEALLGTRTEQALRRISPDIAFLGADGVDPARGINCPDYEQAALKETMTEGQHTSWVLADHTKLRPSAAFRYWAAMPKASGIVTDANPLLLAGFESSGWTIRSTTWHDGSQPTANTTVRRSGEAQDAKVRR